MTRHRSISAIAGEDLSAGTFVELRDGIAFADPTLALVGGVVQNNGSSFGEGEPISVLTDGGILTKIHVTVTIKVRGSPCTLYAFEPYYLRLQGGRPIGFDGDHRVIS